jgi:hypothetical protein
MNKHHKSLYFHTKISEITQKAASPKETDSKKPIIKSVQTFALHMSICEREFAEIILQKRAL